MQQPSGILSATGAYILWGLLPIYWKELYQIPASEILCHRMVWSLFFTAGLILLMRRSKSLVLLVRDRKKFTIFTIAAILLAMNWLLYIWAVNAGFVIEASLGYFINPLIVVLFGVIFLKERLRPGQVAAIAVAFSGVMYLTFYYGQFPWIALSLACSFGVYGLLHKKTSAPALEGLCLETIVLFLPATLFLATLEFEGRGSFIHGSTNQTLLLLGSGLVTTLPLLFFGYAAQKIPLTQLGLLQYIAPSISLFLGIYIFHEPFPLTRMVGFALIWSALFLYVTEGLYQKKRQRKLLRHSETTGRSSLGTRGN